MDRSLCAEKLGQWVNSFCISGLGLGEAYGQHVGCRVDYG